MKYFDLKAEIERMVWSACLKEDAPGQHKIAQFLEGLADDIIVSTKESELMSEDKIEDMMVDRDLDNRLWRID